MGHAFHIAQSQWQHGLGSLQCLDLRLLIYPEHHGVTRRSQVQTYNVMHLIHKERIVRNLEMTLPMRVKIKQLEPAMDRGLGNTRLLCQGTDTPMAAIGWRILQYRIEHFGYTLLIVAARPSRSLFVLESFKAMVLIATAPFTNRDRAQPQPLGNQPLGLSFSTPQNDLRTLHLTVGQRA